jgi:uncharacterized membrane protein HdeD (DUF308 family)
MDIQQKTDWGVVAGGAILLIIGLVCMFYPGLTLAILSVIAGVGFLLTGLTSLMAYLRTRNVLQLSGWALVYAVLDIVAGLLFIIYPVALSAVIPWICGVFVLAFGVFELVGAFKLRGLGVGVWGWTLASGIISVIIGMCFFLMPEMLSVLIGLFAVMQGISMTVYGVAVGKVELF